MNNLHDPRILRAIEDAGWIVQCERPLEIGNPTSMSFASGEAAKIVIDSIVKEARESYEPHCPLPVYPNAELTPVTMPLGYRLLYKGEKKTVGCLRWMPQTYSWIHTDMMVMLEATACYIVPDIKCDLWNAVFE